MKDAIRIVGDLQDASYREFAIRVELLRVKKKNIVS